MYQYKNLMVALDLSYMDEYIIEYTSFVSSLIKPEKIYFINIQRDLELPDEVMEELEAKSKPRDEILRNEMIEKVKASFRNHNSFDIEYQVAEGESVNEILHWSKVKLIDLLILGRKDLANGSGHTAQVFARKVMCSVLMVPENPTVDLQEILVPVDFSEYSDMAVDKAIEVARNRKGLKLFFLHVFTLPIGYYSTGKSEEEFTSIMRKNAEKEFNKYIENKDLEGIDFTPIYSLDKEGRPEVLIKNHAHDTETDLIIMGAKGRTPATSMFLGSVAEKLVKMDLSIPLLVAKSKEKSFDILEWIKSV